MRGSGLNHADGIVRIASSIGFGATAARADIIVSVTYQSQSVQGDVAIVPATSARLVKAFVELPYTLALPDWDSDKWRVHRDLIAASANVIHRLDTAGEPQHDYLRALRDHDKDDLQLVDTQFDGFLEARDQSSVLGDVVCPHADLLSAGVEDGAVIGLQHIAVRSRARVAARAAVGG